MDQMLVLEQRSDPCDMLYSETMGSLQNLSIGTRPDISQAVARLAKYVECLNSLHKNCIN